LIEGAESVRRIVWDWSGMNLNWVGWVWAGLGVDETLMELDGKGPVSGLIRWDLKQGELDHGYHQFPLPPWPLWYQDIELSYPDRPIVLCSPVF
jgi:hypothetical protein